MAARRATSLDLTLTPRVLSPRAQVAVGCMSVFVVLVVQFLFPRDPRSGEAGLGTPWWAMILILAYTFVTSFGCCYIYVRHLLVVPWGLFWSVAARRAAGAPCDQSMRDRLSRVTLG